MNIFQSKLAPNRGYPCFGLAAIFAGMLYNVQIIQKSSTRNIMRVNIIVLKLLAKLHEVIVKGVPMDPKISFLALARNAKLLAAALP